MTIGLFRPLHPARQLRQPLPQPPQLPADRLGAFQQGGVLQRPARPIAGATAEAGFNRLHPFQRALQP